MKSIVVLHLDKLLKERGISQRAFEKQTGIYQATLSKMSNNTLQHMPLDALAKICDELECEITDVMTLEKERPE